MKTTAFLLLLAVVLRVDAEPVLLTVSAAISLQAPLEALKVDFEKANPGIGILLNFGSSGSLQQQIVNGAPVDVFISAAARQMDELEKCGMIIPASRLVVVRNALVLVVPAGMQAIAGFGDLASVRTLAIGEPKSVPAGMYAMETLDHLGLVDALKDKLVFAKDARQVLVYVETGNADAGIVYASDAAGSKAVRVVAFAPEGSHKSVEYPAAIVSASSHAAEAAGFLHFLRSRPATELFKSAGFVTASGP